MKIGINALFLIPGNVGGTETYLCDILLAATRLFPEHRWTIFTNRENDALFRGLFAGCPAVEYRTIRVRARNRISRIAAEQFTLPGQVALSGVELLWSPGYTAPLRCACRQVVTIHDMQYRRFPDDFSLAGRLALRMLVPATARACDAVITGSEFSRGEIVKYTGVGPGLVRVIPYGVNSEFGVRLSPGRIRDASGRLVGTGSPYILCVSASYPHKGLDCLVEAFGCVADRIPHKLVLVGHAARGEPALSAAIARIADPGRVVRLKQLSRDDLVALYQGAELFALPSLYEGFGLPVIEAMLAGVPVVAARVSAIPEVGGDCVIYFDPRREGDLKERILDVIAMKADRRRELAGGGVKRAAEFTWERAARETIACFTRTISSPGGKTGD